MVVSKESGYRSILVPITRSGCAVAALEHAIELAQEGGARLTLLHVIEPSSIASLFATGSPALESEEEAELVLERAAARVPDGLPVATIVRRGVAADEILRRIDYR